MGDDEPAVPEGFGICEANTIFSELTERVTAGEEIVIARGGAPVRILAPISSAIRGAVD